MHSNDRRQNGSSPGHVDSARGCPSSAPKESNSRNARRARGAALLCVCLTLVLPPLRCAMYGCMQNCAAHGLYSDFLRGAAPVATMFITTLKRREFKQGCSEPASSSGPAIPINTVQRRRCVCLVRHEVRCSPHHCCLCPRRPCNQFGCLDSGDHLPQRGRRTLLLREIQFYLVRPLTDGVHRP